MRVTVTLTRVLFILCFVHIVCVFFFRQGLVCITPGAGFVNITGAFVSGLLAGPTCFAACQLKKTFNFDDALVCLECVSV
jgi:ammonia channel protein AmtB